ncbi:MAG TPA: hypothetical protein V6D28_21320 [Leptolyngbyaceae cyanobacterium]
MPCLEPDGRRMPACSAISKIYSEYGTSIMRSSPIAGSIGRT